MNFLLVLLIIFFFIGCNFSIPDENKLLNLNEPLIFFNINGMRTKIERLPNNVNVTNSADWTINQSIFTISIESITTEIINIGSNTYYVGYHPTYIVYLESDEPVELLGYDSIKAIPTIEILNSNAILNGLTNVDELEVQARAFDELTYHAISDFSALKQSAVPFYIRLYLKIKSGYNFQELIEIEQNGQRRTLEVFFPNTATYKVQFYLEGLRIY